MVLFAIFPRDSGSLLDNSIEILNFQGNHDPIIKTLKEVYNSIVSLKSSFSLGTFVQICWVIHYCLLNNDTKIAIC